MQYQSAAMWVATLPLLTVAACGLIPAVAAVPAPPGGNHLWFRSFIPAIGEQCGATADLRCLVCGEIDAGPRMPDGLFGPYSNYANSPLQRYGDLTVDLYRVNVKLANGKSTEVRVERGRCADKNYTVPRNSKENVPWAPSEMMDQICQRKCKCNYLNKNKTVPTEPGTKIPLPECIDANYAGPFCSLCGPKYNQPIEIAMFACTWEVPWSHEKCPGPEARPPEGSNAKDSVGLVPLPHCNKAKRNVCYQGTAVEVAAVVKLDPDACKPPLDAKLVPYQWYDSNPCYDSGFGELEGYDPDFAPVQLWGCGDTCGPNPNNYGECAVLQGRTQGTGMYCIGPPKKFSDGTLRNASIVTCQGNPVSSCSPAIVRTARPNWF